MLFGLGMWVSQSDTVVQAQGGEPALRLFMGFTTPVLFIKHQVLPNKDSTSTQ